MKFLISKSGLYIQIAIIWSLVLWDRMSPLPSPSKFLPICGIVVAVLCAIVWRKEQ